MTDVSHYLSRSAKGVIRLVVDGMASRSRGFRLPFGADVRGGGNSAIPESTPLRGLSGSFLSCFSLDFIGN